jgi:hypothetical protein
MVWVIWNWSTSSQWWFPPKITEALILILATPQQTHSLTYMPINIPYTMRPARASPPHPRIIMKSLPQNPTPSMDSFFLHHWQSTHPTSIGEGGLALFPNSQRMFLFLVQEGCIIVVYLLIVIVDINLDGRPLSQKLSLVYWYTRRRL